MNIHLHKFVIIITCLYLVLLTTDAYCGDVYKILKDAGVEMQQPPGEYSNEFAEEIIDRILPRSNISKLVKATARTGEALSVLNDYGDRGKSLSLQKALDLNTFSTFDVLIEREQDIKLRHKIVIGTDRAHWEVIRKETTYPNKRLFKRIYLLVQSRGPYARMSGIVFYKGASATIDLFGPVNDSTIKTLGNVTWEMAKELELVYESKLKSISEGPLFKNNPTLTRPDLPDPDTQ